MHFSKYSRHRFRSLGGLRPRGNSARVAEGDDDAVSTAIERSGILICILS